MRELLERLLRGDKAAVALCMAVFEWANDYDHIVDGDAGPRTPEQTLHDAMWTAMVVIPQNPFFQAFQTELVPSLANGISSWRVSTALQRDGDEHGLMLAHVLRWNLIEFFLHCARLAVSREWADAQGPAFWRAMTKDHSFAEFVASAKGAA